jgi:hypothetical protein
MEDEESYSEFPPSERALHHVRKYEPGSFLRGMGRRCNVYHEAALGRVGLSRSVAEQEIWPRGI